MTEDQARIQALVRREFGAGPIRPEDITLVGPPIISESARRKQAEGRLWAEGYTRAELDRAQAKYDLPFPPDLVALFLKRRPVLGWDWRYEESEIRTMLARPYEGLLFDVEHNTLWWPEWGPRPNDAGTRASVLRHVVDAAPKLIPLVGHRYLPCEPFEAGNPVFSIMHSDVIYYGSDLENYFAREFGPHPGPEVGRAKHISFWSDLVERY